MLNKILNVFKNYFVFFFFLILLFASNYYLFNNKFFLVHDYTHAARIAEMGRSLKEGAFPVRWSENFGFGFGMPLFNFYAPLPYFVGALFWLMGTNVVVSIKILYFLSSLISLLGAFKLGKKLFGNWGGLLLGAAYLLAPYRAVNLFVRGALSEAWAMAFLPWVLFAVFSWIDTKKDKFLLTLISSLVAIILSHNLTALMFIPLSGLIAFLYLLQKERWNLKISLKKILPLLFYYILAALLTAFYMLPAFMEKGSTQIEKIFSGYFHYSHHFLYIRQFFKDNWQYGGSAWGPDDGISFFLGYGQLLAMAFLAIFFLLYLFKNFKKIKSDRKIFLTVLFGVTLVILLLMSLLKTKFIWDKISLLQYIQFPWRFLAPASLILAILVAISPTFIKKRTIRITYSFLLMLFLLSNARFFKGQSYLDNADALYYDDAERIQNEMSGILPDYIPIQMIEEKKLKELNLSQDFIWEENIKDPKIKGWNLIADRGHEKLVSINVNQDTLINLKLANFPGWIAQIDNNPVDVLENPEIGNIQILVPEGEHKLTVQFSEKTPARLIGNSLSILGLFTLLYIFSPFKEKKRKNS